MENNVEKQLLQTNNLDDFKKICKKNGILSFKNMSESVMKHYSHLGNGGNAYNHSDPRKK